jgi:NAD(P)H-hydrate epimerase
MVLAVESCSMLPVKEFTVLDINSEQLGVPQGFLMENAGRSIAEAVCERYGQGMRIAVVCGTGNNGGDGLVAARYLRQGNEVAVFMAKFPEEIKTDIARDAFEAVKDMVRPAASADLRHFEIIVDALFGTGVSGHIREPYASLINAINSSGSAVVSVDVPSGLGCELAVRPDLTVTLHDSKQGMTAQNSGEIVVRDIGIPAEAALYTGPGELAYYPIPTPDSHKGDNGRVLIVGGGPYTGAPALAGMGAFGIKVDLVHIATPARSYIPIASYSPNFIVHRLGGKVLTKEEVPLLKELTKKADAVLVGPGLGDAAETMEAVRNFIRACDRPLVIDADAIGAVAKDMTVLKGKKGVITPHAGEFAKLSGRHPPQDYEARIAPAQELARTTGMTILLKGRIDVIADAERAKLNRTGNPGMSVGGTGDVLAGEVAGLMSRGVEPFEAARIAAFINGIAGDLAYEEFGFSLQATQVAERVPKALKPFLDRFIYP